MPDLESFEREFMGKLKRDRMVFVSEIFGLGKKYGLSEEQVDRILEQALKSGIGFTDMRSFMPKMSLRRLEKKSFSKTIPSLPRSTADWSRGPVISYDQL